MRLNAFLILLMLWAETVFSQNTIGLPLVRNYNKTEYRGGSQTWDIDQDTNGRMYFANNEGLITYDGTYWKNFSLPNKSILRAVKVGANGLVYAGGQGEAGYFAPGRGGQFVFHSIVQMIPADGRNFADIWNIEIVGDAVFFRASDRVFELSNQSVRVHWAPHEWVFMELAAGKLLVQDKKNGIFQWVNGMWRPLQNGQISGTEVLHGTIPVAADSVILVTNNARRLMLSGGKITPMANLAIGNGVYISDIESLNTNEFVVGTANIGCIIVNKAGNIIQSISNREGLQDNNILCTFRDSFGNLWVGMNNGFSMVAYNSPIKFIKPNKASELSCYSAKIFNDRLYVATNDGAYSVSISGGPNDLSFCKGDFGLIPLTWGQGYRFDEINQSLLLAHNEGILKITGESATKISHVPAWMFLPIGSVMPATRILVGNYTGFKWLNYAAGAFSETPNLKGLRESFRIVAVDNEESLWASHPYRGIFKISFPPDSSNYQSQLFGEKEGLPSSLDNHVFRIRNRVIFATVKGPFEYDKAAKKFIPSPFFSPLLGNTPLRYLKEDQDGNVWFISGKQLGFLEFSTKFKKGSRITYFPETNGQVLSGFENVYPFNRENVFVSSEKGIIHINLAKYLRASEKPKLLLSTALSFGSVDSLLFQGFGQVGKNGLSGKITLPYNGNSLHFEYSSPAYGFQENIEYSYMLEGIENEWSKWSSKPEKDYTSLPNGDYTFKVKGRSNLGNETDVAVFAFTISPPWYKSWLAFVFYLIWAVMLIYLLLYYHRKKLTRQKLEYEEKQAQLRVVHQLEIEKNEKEIIRLQNEKLANEVSFKNRELADTAMHLVERTDALEKVKEMLQKLYKGDTGNGDLKRAIHLLNDIERNNSDWDRFSASFDEINNDFLKKLKAKYPLLTNNDLKLCAYLQLNMSSKEIAQLLNISLRGVEISRYRLRKKLGVSTEVSISDFLNETVA